MDLKDEVALRIRIGRQTLDDCQRVIPMLETDIAKPLYRWSAKKKRWVPDKKLLRSLKCELTRFQEVQRRSREGVAYWQAVQRSLP